MSSFDQALTHVYDALTTRRASGNEAERASLTSLQRLVEATASLRSGNGSANGGGSSKQAATGQQSQQPQAGRPLRGAPNPATPAEAKQTPPASTQAGAPQTASPFPTAAAAPASAPVSSEKLSFADRVRAAMAANAPGAPAAAAPIAAPAPSPAPYTPLAAAPTPPRSEVTPHSEDAPMPRRPKPLNLRDRLEQLNTRVSSSSDAPVVLGTGGLHALLMIVGFGPGEDEIAANTPVAGEAGELLGKITTAMGLTKEELYLTNLYKSAPHHTSREKALAVLTEEIQIIRPKCIVTLGLEPLEVLVGESAPIQEERGHWHAYKGTPLMPTFHPDYLLTNPAMSEKRKLWEDMLQVLELLAKPITPRQRSFFQPRG